MENFLLLKTGRTTAYLFINCLGFKKYTYIPFLPTDGSILHLPFIILMILYFINSRILSFLYFNITKIEMCLIVNIILTIIVILDWHPLLPERMFASVSHTGLLICDATVKCLLESFWISLMVSVKLQIHMSWLVD